MKKYIFLIAALTAICGVQAQSDNKTYYLSTNILAPVAGLNKGNAIAQALLPLASNLEYGVTLSAGYFKGFHALETRLSYGKSTPYSRIPQLQLVYNFFLLDYFKHNQSGWYLGANARYWIYNNSYTHSNLHNVSSNINLGYVWRKKKIICDIRLNQPITIFSASDIEHSKAKFEANFSPMPNFSPVLPFLSINLGYQFKKKA